MPINTTLAGLSQTPSSNGPDGTVDAPATIDDAIRNALSFTAMLRDNVGFTAGAKAALGNNTDITSLSILPGYLFGCTLSTAGASTTMSISAGKAQDSTGVQLMTLAAIAKTTAAWTVGTAAGGLDTGTIAANTWYHFYVIRRPDTGVVDVLFSLSATAPALPANYTQFRRIGSDQTNGASQWTKFRQVGDLFLHDVPVNNVNTTNPGVAAILSALQVPPGVATTAVFNAFVNNVNNSNIAVLFSDPNGADNAPDTTTSFSMVTSTLSATSITNGQFQIPTNLSQQIRYRLSASGASDLIRITTIGYIDTRGRNA